LRSSEELNFALGTVCAFTLVSQWHPKFGKLHMRMPEDLEKTS